MNAGGDDDAPMGDGASPFAAVPPSPGAGSSPGGGRDRWLTLAALLAIAIGVVLLLVWAVGRATLDESDDGAMEPARAIAATTAPTTPDGLGLGQGDEVGGRRPLRGFGEVQATVTAAGGETCEVCLLVAHTPEQRARGLMEVRDLGGYDGMVFVFDGPVEGAFYMRNTPTPLSIAYFDARGRFVSSADMAPCDDVEGCPTYGAEAPYRYSVEVPDGGLPAVGIDGDGASVRLDDSPCPLVEDLQRADR